MLHVIVLALGSAFYPLGVAAVLVMLGSPQPLRMLIGYLAGGALVSVGLGLIAVFVLGSAGVSQGSNKGLSPAIDVAAGALALLIAYVVATNRARNLRLRRRKTRSEPVATPSWTERVLAKNSAVAAFFVGMAMSLPSVYYVAALPYIATHYSSSAAQVGLVLLFNVIQFALVEVPIGGFVVAPERTASLVEGLIGWLKEHRRQIAVVILVLGGVYLLVHGVYGLAN